MNFAILSTENHPIISYFLFELYKSRIKNFIVIFDEKKTSLKDCSIVNKRTKNFFKKKKNNLRIILKKFNISHFYVKNHNSHDCEKLIKRKKLDLLINSGSPRKINKNILKSTNVGILNVHPGMLPKYKGQTCVEWSIYNNDKVGNTLHLMDEKYDSGPIVKTETYQFSKLDDYYSIRLKVYIYGLQMMINYLKKIQQLDLKKIKSYKQPQKGKFYTAIDEKKMKSVKKILKEGNYKFQI
tara:strand:+ start:804 stop:1523 length:720 start_codon:yes stop_codon:yes gene_type:complete